MGERLASYEAFWPFYVSQHMNQTNRQLHFVGTSLVIAFLALAVVRNPLFALGCPLFGYGFAWVGHFFFERNRPATFTYPLWSLRGDFRMYRLMLLGRMGPELDRAGRLFAARA